MDTKKVISSKNLPTKIPVLSTVVYATALDYWNAPQWLWGAVGLLMALAWIGSIIAKVREEEEDIFETTPKTVAKSKFKDKLKEAMDASNKAKA